MSVARLSYGKQVERRLIDKPKCFVEDYPQQAMDLTAALSDAGLCGPHGYHGRDVAKAVIVDLDELDRRNAIAFPRHRRAEVPIIVIAYDQSKAARIAGHNAIFVSKPVVSHAVAHGIQGLLTKVE